jgi:tetratricopeptide (TPR) repeat protein
VVATPKPADDLPYMQAMWNYGQAMAAVGQGRLDDAKKFHAALTPAASDPVIEKMMTWDRYSLIGGVQVAERFVAAEIARAEKNYDAAIAALNTAVTIEDTLPYDEPPAWNWPTRLALGNVLMDAKKYAEAEQAFRDELQRNPENGWSLNGSATGRPCGRDPVLKVNVPFKKRLASPFRYACGNAARSAASASRACGARK